MISCIDSSSRAFKQNPRSLYSVVLNTPHLFKLCYHFLLQNPYVKLLRRVNQEMFRDIITISVGKHCLHIRTCVIHWHRKMLQELLSIKSIHIIGTNEILRCKQVVTKTEWLPICLEFLKWFLVYCSLNTNRNSHYRHCNSLHERQNIDMGNLCPPLSCCERNITYLYHTTCNFKLII